MAYQDYDGYPRGAYPHRGRPAPYEGYHEDDRNFDRVYGQGYERESGVGPERYHHGVERDYERAHFRQPQYRDAADDIGYPSEHQRPMPMAEFDNRRRYRPEDREMDPNYPKRRRHIDDYGGGRRLPAGGEDFEDDSMRGYPSDGPPRRGIEPRMSYKQFMNKLDDDITPVEAEKKYEEYKAEYTVRQKEFYFHRNKHNQDLKSRYHPESLLEEVKNRNEEARLASQKFRKELAEGTLNLEDDGDESAINGDVEVKIAPAVAWESKRLMHDLRQALTLSIKLDEEKGIEDEPIVAIPSEDHHVDSEEKLEPQPEEDKEKALEQTNLEEKATSGGETAAQMAEDQEEPVKQDEEAQSKVEKEHDENKPEGTIKDENGEDGVEATTVEIKPLTYEESIIRSVDSVIAYLWRVHRVDYYGGAEPPGGLTLEMEGPRHKRRVEDRDMLSGDMYEKVVEAGRLWQESVDETWARRLDAGDPSLELLGEKRVKEAVEDFLRKHCETIVEGHKYKCGLHVDQQKLFYSPEFVHKHILNKHREAVAEVRQSAMEEVFMDNFMNDPESAPQFLGVVPGITELPPSMLDSTELSRKRERGEANNHAEKRGLAKGGMLAGRGQSGQASVLYVPKQGTKEEFVPVPIFGQSSSKSPVVPGRDPRRIRTYVDLDATEDETPVIDYRSIS